VLVVLDNGGGGIFSFLPQASGLDEALFERLFGTPQRIDVAELSRVAGCDTLEVGAGNELTAQLDSALAHAARRGPAVVVVRTDRKANVALHAEIEAEVALRLG
jgi:2-succinyl-5-enolpyruvyl-6-hydroxy-3-cyclohexene-1-carboxylate synthase